MSRISSAAYVTAVLRFLQGYNAGDFDACMELLDPEVEWHGSVSYSGRDEIRAYLESFHGRWGRSHARPEDFRETAGRVLIVVSFTGENIHTQRVLEERQSWICELSDSGKITRVLTYSTAADAMKAFEDLSQRPIHA